MALRLMLCAFILLALGGCRIRVRIQGASSPRVPRLLLVAGHA